MSILGDIRPEPNPDGQKKPAPAKPEKKPFDFKKTGLK